LISPASFKVLRCCDTVDAASDKLNAALERAVLLKVRDSTALFEEYRRDSRFPELKVGLPFLLVTDANGSLLYKTSDYTKTDEIALFLGE